MYKVKYTGSGRIEIDLPSYPSGVIIEHNQFARLNLNESDKRVIRSLRHLGLSFEQIVEEEKAPVVEKDSEIKVEELKIEEPVVEEPKIEEPVEVKEEKPAAKKVTKEELMKKTAVQLKSMLSDAEDVQVNNLSKSQLADIILERLNG